jgi:hypothetical protein
MDSNKKETFMSKTFFHTINNFSSIINLSIEVEYMDKCEIFKLEDDYKKIEDDNMVFRRPRFLSEDNSNYKFNIPSFEILNFEDTSIRDNYFSKK